MTQSPASEFITAKATEIVVALLAARPVDPADLPQLVRAVRAALSDELSAIEVNATAKSFREPRRAAPVTALPARSKAEEAASAIRAEPQLRPAVAVADSIHRDYLVSLEDGKHYRSLRRHLMAKYGMTPEDYRRRWNLPADYPMVAPSYAEQRSEVAKRSGLGTSATKRTAR